MHSPLNFVIIGLRNVLKGREIATNSKARAYPLWMLLKIMEDP